MLFRSCVSLFFCMIIECSLSFIKFPYIFGSCFIYGIVFYVVSGHSWLALLVFPFYMLVSFFILVILVICCISFCSSLYSPILPFLLSSLVFSSDVAFRAFFGSSRTLSDTSALFSSRTLSDITALFSIEARGIQNSS